MAEAQVEGREEEEEQEEEEQEVAEEIAEVPEFPEPCYYCVKQGDSLFSVASKFRIDSLALHRTDDWDFSTNGIIRQVHRMKNLADRSKKKFCSS